MTIQEFVIKESKNFADVEIGDRAKFISHRSVDEWNTSSEGFKNGLTKGLEIAKEAILFIANCTEETANEIVQKVITEKYGK